MSPGNGPSFLALPIEISDQILGYLLPDRDVIQVDLATRPSRDSRTFDTRFRYDNDACHLNILRTNRQLYEEGSRITYKRTFLIELDSHVISFNRHEYPTPFGRNSKHRLPGPLFEKLQFPFAKVRRLEIQLRDVVPDLLDLVTNITMCCRRLDKEPSLKSLQIRFPDYRFLIWPNNRGQFLDFQRNPDRRFNRRKDVQVVLRQLAHLRNVGKASIILPQHQRENSEYQTLVRECEQMMMTTRSSEEQATHEQLSRADPEPEPHEEDLLEQAGFGVSFYRRQRFNDKWDELLLDILPYCLRLPGRLSPWMADDLTENELLEIHS